MKKYIYPLLKYSLALFMVLAGVKHFTLTAPYLYMIPEWMPLHEFIVYASGVVEIVLALLLFLRGRWSTFGAFGLFLLMVAFLPLHIADLFREVPSISHFPHEGTSLHVMVRMRIVMQLVFLAWTFTVAHYTRLTQGRFFKTCPFHNCKNKNK